MNRTSVAVRVPASTSNLGSGFDTLGLALSLFAKIQVTRTPGITARVVSCADEKERPKAEQIIREAAKLFFKSTDCPRFGIEVALGGDIPVGRGLGASGAARVGVLTALNELADSGLSRQALLELATQLEGHPDNASPALFGGFTVSGRVNGHIRCLRFPTSMKLKLVTLIPPFPVSTQAARRLVPSKFSRTDTVHSLNRAAAITAAFAGKTYEALRGLFDDRLHQPYRERLVPRLSYVIRAGEGAGALGGWLSGSGSAIMCVTLRNQREIARAMLAQWPETRIEIFAPDNDGVKVGNHSKDWDDD